MATPFWGISYLRLEDLLLAGARLAAALFRREALAGLATRFLETTRFLALPADEDFLRTVTPEAERLTSA